MGSESGGRFYIVPWRSEPIPQTEWITVNSLSDNANYSPFANFFLFFQGSNVMAVRFDPKTRSVSEPYELKNVPGNLESVKSDDAWGIRGPGLVFARRARTSSVWLMRPPQ